MFQSPSSENHLSPDASTNNHIDTQISLLMKCVNVPALVSPGKRLWGAHAIGKNQKGQVSQ